GRERKPRGRAGAAVRVVSSNPSFGSVHSTYAEKHEVDSHGTKQDSQPGGAQIRPDDARELSIDRAALHELLVPAVLKRIGEAVREKYREVGRERGALTLAR